MSDTKWDEDRKEELLSLIELLNEIGGINRGSHALERIARCISLAGKLSNVDLESGRDSFVTFLIRGSNK